LMSSPGWNLCILHTACFIDKPNRYSKSDNTACIGDYWTISQGLC
jgi:hypothetical protein